MKRFTSLQAFRYRDFAIFWSGAIVSNVGSWLQNLTVPFVIFEVTHSALWVGIAAAAQFLPGLIGSPIGGHLADSRERRTLLLVLLGIMAVGAFTLWWVWAAGSRSVALILILVAAMGLVWGMALPTWQAFVNDLVPRSALVSAVSLNSLQFNGARALGPAVAGIVVATIGPGGAFALNAVSFLFVLGAIALVKARSRVQRDEANRRLISGLIESVRYVPTQPGIAMVILLVILLAIFGTPVFGFTIVIGSAVYGVGAFQIGLLNAALGVGAVAAVPMVVRAKSHGGLSTAMRLGLLVMGVAVAAFGLAPGFWWGALALVPVGFGFLLTISGGNTAIQLIVAERLRGRVMALRLMGYMVCTTVGALLFGVVADHVGPRITMGICGAMITLIALWLYTRSGARRLRHVDDPRDVATA